MTIDEAIKILEIVTHNYPQKGTDNFVDALKLGIEALKRLQVLRAPGPKEEYRLLPSETEADTC
ncbi:hypothetical protein ES705_37657 [subsurface metagenome]